MQIVQLMLDGVMDAIIAEDAILDPAAVFVGVATAITPQGLATLLADLTEPNATAFPRQPVTAWSDPYNLNDGRRVVDGPLMHFTPDSTDHGATLVAWFLADAVTAGNLLAFGLIEPNIPLPGPGSVWSIVPRVTVDPDGRWSAEITYNG